MRLTFEKIVAAVVEAAGSPVAIALAVGLILGWGVVGPFVGYSEPWQLSVNTGTTIITFIMTFFILNSQNRSERGIHAKLDEILRAVKDADDADLVGVEKPEVDTDEAIARAKLKHQRSNDSTSEGPSSAPDEP